MMMQSRVLRRHIWNDGGRLGSPVEYSGSVGFSCGVQLSSLDAIQITHRRFNVPLQEIWVCIFDLRRLPARQVALGVGVKNTTV